MFEEKVSSDIEDRGAKMVDRRSWIVDCVDHDLAVASCFLRSTAHDLRSTFLIALATLALFLPNASLAQQNWYYHTIHSSTLAAQYGRTFKLTYAYQLSRSRQLKLSAYYISDGFDLGEDRVDAKMYNANLEFQYHLFHVGKLFVHTHAGAGGYKLEAKNVLDQKHKETKFSFTGGFQGEFFIARGALALVADYDVLYVPFSDLYEFLHLPRVGLAWTF